MTMVAELRQYCCPACGVLVVDIIGGGVPGICAGGDVAVDIIKTFHADADAGIRGDCGVGSCLLALPLFAMPVAYRGDDSGGI